MDYCYRRYDDDTSPVIFDLTPEQEAEVVECDDDIDRSPWGVVGTLKATPKPAPDLKPLAFDESPQVVRPVPVPVCERFLVDEEATLRGDWGSVDALMPTRLAATAPLALKAEYDDVEELVGDMLADFKASAAAQALAPSGPVRGPIALEAAVPGAGKTYLVLSWLERTGQKETAVIVCPWNALVTKLVRDGWRAVTLHELVGRLAVETEDGVSFKKAYNLDGVTHVHFEEVYLYPVHQMGWIRSFLLGHPALTYSEAGDPGQNAPVHQSLSVDSDAWYEMALATMFPRRICLRVSKRVADPGDRARMMSLCEELRAEARPVADILRAAGLPTVRFDALTEADARYPHVAAMRSTVSRVDYWAHELIGETYADEGDVIVAAMRVGMKEVGPSAGTNAPPPARTSPAQVYLKGQELLGVDGCRCKGGRIASNETYTVAEVDASGLTLTAPDGSRRVVTMAAARRYLKRPYCRTGHSTQGLTLGERIYLHDWKSSMATHRWVRTAVSRCSTLDIVLVEDSEGLRSNWRASESRIEAHRAADLAKGFVWDRADYVTCEWVAEKLRIQRFSCWGCSEPLGPDWSIDRIVNELPHIKSNSAISCRRCQCASAHRA